MQVKIKRIDKALPLPQYETQGAVAFDFIARVNTVIEPHGIGRIPSNIVLEIPKGYMVLVKDRSSTAKKKGILMTAGVIDQDYCGDNDEILMQFYNPSDVEITVKRGERVAQGIFVAVGIGEWEEVDIMNKKDRGGFGTTDQKQSSEVQEQKIRIEASSGLSDAEIEKMKKEAEANAESDKKAKEEVEKINGADQMIFQTEKQLKDYGDKIPAEKKADIEGALTELKTAHEQKDIVLIDAAMEKMNKAWEAASQDIYNAQQGEGGAESAEGQAPGGEANTEDVQDVDFEEVK